MRRRGYIKLGGSMVGMGIMSGCIRKEQPPDSDGDGVDDRNDYAPQDPAVQHPKDVLKEPTETDVVVPTYKSDTDVKSTFSSNAIQSTIEVSESDVLQSLPHFTEYGLFEVVLNLEMLSKFIEVNSPDFEDDRLKIIVVANRARETGIVGVGESEGFDVDTIPSSIQVDVSYDTLPEDTQLYFSATLVPETVTVNDTFQAGGLYLHETDEFVAHRENGISPSPSEYEQGETQEQTFIRKSVEGVYVVRYRGQTDASRWTIGYYIFKSEYNRKRGLSRTDDTLEERSRYVLAANSTGDIGRIATLVKNTATELGATTTREYVEFALDVIQTIPYRADIETGFDDYTKHVSETLVEGEGDCEDTAVLLAAILRSDVFGLDVAFLSPPNHLAVGVSLPETELDGQRTYGTEQQYYYVETTGSGWGVGETPQMFETEEIRVLPI